MLLVQLVSSQELQQKEPNLLVENQGLTDVLDSSTFFPRHQYGFEVGASAFTNFNKGYGFNTYVAPRFSLKPFKRLQLDMFGGLGRTSYYNFPVWSYYGQEGVIDQKVTNLGVYGQATYSLNPRLYIGGAGFVDHSVPDKNPLGPALSHITNYGAKSYVGYKFSNSFRVEAGFGVSKYPSYPGVFHHGAFDPGYHWRSTNW
jgi:hypothetical protein